jgi:D-alanyl-lipoteichoic acid acyltransferase DltB (MBOAT superfamily)
LGLSSLAFYAAWDARYLLLLLGSILGNYSSGYFIGKKRTSEGSREASLALWGAITANLALLAYFKYATFFVVSANDIFSASYSVPDIVLPLGISFFTFTQIAFLVDVYRGKVHEYSFPHYVLFVTYFPHLIAGPVLHHKQMMPQFADPKTYRVNLRHVAVGATIFLLGLSKKVLIADYFSQYASPIFEAVRADQEPKFFEAWLGALTYTLQLYFDFSGYCDMAIGASLLFNVRLPLNFNSPYKATSIIDFWRRWHMTLSAFLRDYLYFPLGGNRKGPVRRYVNLLTTMLIGGLWHGAGWTFVAWGGLHGLYLVINHGWRSLAERMNWKSEGRLGGFAGGILTFLSVVVGWVFFRADSFKSAWTLLAGMSGLNGFSLPQALEAKVGPFAVYLSHFHLSFDGLLTLTGGAGIPFLTVPLAFALVWLFPNIPQMFAAYRPTWDQLADSRNEFSAPTGSWTTWRPSIAWAVLVGLLFAASLFYMASNRTSEFIYFQF